MTAALEEDDLSAWVHEAARAAIPESGPFVIGEIAAKVLDALESEDPEGFEVWLRENAVALLSQQIGHILRSDRERSRNAAKRGAFADFAERHAAGLEPAALQWDVKHCVNDGNEWLPEREFTRPDALFIADGYQARGRAALMEEAFYRAVAKKLTGARQVCDVWTPETYQAMRNSICGGDK